MSKAARITLVIISLALFLGIPALAALRIWDASNTGYQAANRHFARIVNTAEQARNLLDQQEFGPFAEEVGPVARAAESLSVLVIAGNGGKIDYAWSRREARLPTGISDLSLERDIVHNEPWERQFDARIESENRGQFLVSAVYETLEQNVVFSTLRDALLAILAFALLVLVVLIGSLRTDNPHARPEQFEPSQSVDRSSPPGTRESMENTTRTDLQSPSETEPQANEGGQYPSEGGSQPASDEPRSTPDASGSEADGRTEFAPPLVSPNSGLSFENHLPRRLSLELERAAENNLDLSLLILRVTDAEGIPVTLRLLGTLILEQFPFEDLTFEYSPAGACIILTGIDLDTALRKAERLRTALRRHELGNYRVRAGASSRNGRLVESDRLIREAHEAFGRSDAQSFAVGFRPDPDRYRSYIASRTDGAR